MFAFVGASWGCGEMPPADVSEPGPTCRALLDATQRASACDPVLAQISEADFVDEKRCQRAIRRIIDGSPAVAETTSLHRAASEEPVIGEAQLAALRELPLPATLHLRPDLPAGPGVPMTSAKLAGRTLARAESGQLEIHAQAGRHLLHIDHAGIRQSYCVRLAQCQRLDLTVHGSTIADHPHVDAGTCEPPATAQTQPPAVLPHSLTRR